MILAADLLAKDHRLPFTVCSVYVLQLQSITRRVKDGFTNGQLPTNIFHAFTNNLRVKVMTRHTAVVKEAVMIQGFPRGSTRGKNGEQQ